MSTRPRSPRISGEPPGKAPTAMEQHKDSNRMSRKVSGLHVLTGMYIRNVRIYIPIPYIRYIFCTQILEQNFSVGD